MRRIHTRGSLANMPLLGSLLEILARFYSIQRYRYIGNDNYLNRAILSEFSLGLPGDSDVSPGGGVD